MPSSCLNRYSSGRVRPAANRARNRATVFDAGSRSAVSCSKTLLNVQVPSGVPAEMRSPFVRKRVVISRRGRLSKVIIGVARPQAESD